MELLHHCLIATIVVLLFQQRNCLFFTITQTHLIANITQAVEKAQTRSLSLHATEELHNSFVRHFINKRLFTLNRVAASKMLSSPLPVLSVRLDGTPPSWCKARRVCVRLCLDIRSSQLQDFLVFAMPASGSCVRHAQWREAGEKGEVEEEQSGDEERKGICVHSELSKDSPSTSVQSGTAVHWLHGIRGRRCLTPAARLTKVVRRTTGSIFIFKVTLNPAEVPSIKLRIILTSVYVQTGVIK